jgi:hypothetical protein
MYDEREQLEMKENLDVNKGSKDRNEQKTFKQENR